MSEQQFDLAEVAEDGFQFLANFMAQHPEHQTDVNLLAAMSCLGIVGRQISGCRALIERQDLECSLH